MIRFPGLPELGPRELVKISTQNSSRTHEPQILMENRLHDPFSGARLKCSRYYKLHTHEVIMPMKLPQLRATAKTCLRVMLMCVRSHFGSSYPTPFDSTFAQIYVARTRIPVF